MLNEKKLDRILALIVFVASVGVYYATMAPTVSFWDCGELLGASNILGNPHPPGNPLFTLIARVFIMLVPFAEKAARVNIISVLTSAATVTLCFLFSLKLLRILFRNGSLPRFALYTGSLIGAALVALGDTFWFSAVEAEVYGCSMFLVMSISWLALHWYERRGTPAADRSLLLLAYLGFLGMGIHPFSFITIPVVGLFMLIADKDTRTNIPLIVSSLVLFSVIYDIGNFIFYAAGTLVFCALALLLAKSPEWRRRWLLAASLALVALLGFSTYVYVPLRSAANVAIDEGEPHTWPAFKEYLERKQYGSDPMLARAMHRRGLLQNQVLVHPNMGYGGYMLSQYFPWKVGETSAEESENVERHVFGKKVEFATLYQSLASNPRLQLILFILFQIPFLYGGYLVYKRDKSLGIYLLTLYAVTTFGLVFYLNFADGTQMEYRDWQYWKSLGFDPAQKPPPVHLEVRDRDYFFTPGFIYMGILFGIAATFLLNWLSTRRRFLMRPAGVSLLVLAVAVPVFSNYKEHNRTGDYVPWDYAYNLLSSCRPNSILFTNGDNDTFPLWFLQEVENYRQDVRVVNLSLANTNWYIQQIREHPPALKMGFSREEIDALQPQPWRFKGPVGIELPNSKIKYTLQPLPYLKVQDIMVLHLIQNNYPEHPVHFAVTVGSENTMGLDPYLQMEGLVYTLTEEVHNRDVAVPITAHLVDSVYKFRGLADPDVYIDKNTEGLLTNYSATNFRLAAWAQDSLQKIMPKIVALHAVAKPSAEDQARMAELERERLAMVLFAQKYLDLNASILSSEWRVYYYAGQLYSLAGEPDNAEKSFQKGLEMSGTNAKIFAMNLAQMYLKENRPDKAIKVLDDMRKRVPADIEVAFGLAEVYQQTGDLRKAREVLAIWLSTNPNNEYAAAVNQQIQGLDAKLQAPAAPGAPGAVPPH